MNFFRKKPESHLPAVVKQNTILQQPHIINNIQTLDLTHEHSYLATRLNSLSGDELILEIQKQSKIVEAKYESIKDRIKTKINELKLQETKLSDIKLKIAYNPDIVDPDRTTIINSLQSKIASCQKELRNQLAEANGYQCDFAKKVSTIVTTIEVDRDLVELMNTQDMITEAENFIISNKNAFHLLQQAQQVMVEALEAKTQDQINTVEARHEVILLHRTAEDVSDLKELPVVIPDKKPKQEGAYYKRRQGVVKPKPSDFEFQPTTTTYSQSATCMTESQAAMSNSKASE